MQNNEIINQTLGNVAPGGDPIALQRNAPRQIRELHAPDALETGARLKAGSELLVLSNHFTLSNVVQEFETSLFADRNTWKSQAKRNFDAIPKGEIIPADDLGGCSSRD